MLSHFKIKPSFRLSFLALFCFTGTNVASVAASLPIASDELKDPIQVLNDADQTLGVLPAERAWLPDIRELRGDVKLGVTRAGHIYVAMAQTLCWTQDGGRTWESRSLPKTSQGGGFGVLRNDTFLLVTGHPPPGMTPRQVGGWTTIGVIRSTDLGRTWSKVIPLDLSPYDAGGAGWSHILQLPDGTVLLTLQLRYGNGKVDLKTQVPLPDERYGIFEHIYRSRDSGATWGDRSLLVQHGGETSLLRLRSGKLMAAIRRGRPREQMPNGLWGSRLLPGDDIAKLQEMGAWQEGTPYIKHAFLAESEDQGYTWKNFRVAPMTPSVKRGLVPSELIQLQDGRVVWIYLQRYGKNTGIYARVSSDGGQTWSEERYRLRLLRDEDEGTYPASTVLKDGTILTVSSKNGGNRALAIRWRLPTK